jgi:hypothetical protein
MSDAQRWESLLGTGGATRNAARALNERQRAERRVEDLLRRLAAAGDQGPDRARPDAA